MPASVRVKERGYRMVFSSNEFLFLFLPVVLILYYLVYKKRTLANLVLTATSLFFYAWGELSFVPIMLTSIFLNWLIALGIEKYRTRKGVSKALMVVSCVMNVGLLGAFKYLSFAIRNLNAAFSLSLPDPQLILPIGISFFTFQAISYVVDVYRGRGSAQRHFLGVCLYISFFPQLIAGPIVRYETVANEIQNRRETFDDFASGCRRFLVGLSKKAILANSLALIVDLTYDIPAGKLSVLQAWLCAISYLMQVYYDFSGYSDMAIGLGRMFGFHFLENFDFPFLSKSVTEFWRRWHISLSTWFRDYVFFPLGGSRVKSKLRLLFNMFVVWSLTGLWHGAEWTYVVWGVSFFVVLAIEKLTGLAKWMEKHWIGHLYAMLIIVVITVLIRSESITGAGTFYATMFGLNAAPLYNSITGMFIHEFGWFFLASAIISMPVGAWLQKALHIPEKPMEILRGVGLVCAVCIAITYVVAGSYNPFIYFNF